MMSWKQAGVEVPGALLREVLGLYEEGLMLRAYELARGAGPLPQWRGTPARLLAGRLAAHLGAPRLSRVLFWRAWREDRQDPDACAFYARTLIAHGDPLAAHEFLRRLEGHPPGEDRSARAHLLSVRAEVASLFRDFETARRRLAEAREVARDDPWLGVAEAFLCEQEDRFEEALACARTALAEQPHYRPGIEATVHALRQLDRETEALALLEGACARTESAALMGQLMSLQMHLGQFEQARASLDHCQALTPLREAHLAEFFRRTRVYLACACGDLSLARELCGRMAGPRYGELAGRLSQPNPPRRRVRLRVPFVRQHHATCVPATFSALSRFWNQPVDHLELAEEICYQGTPLSRERQWAETHGWAVREFTVTWEAAVALLSRGLPFMLVTCDLASAHMQAVVGYDELLGTFLLHDPSRYDGHEVHVRSFLEAYRATGPVGMVIVPDTQSGLLEGLALPDVDLYDRLYLLQSALATHQRPEAAALLEGLEAAAPSHWLTLSARRLLLQYDANTPGLLECLNALLGQFPGDGLLNLSKVGCLQELGRREDRLAFLEKLCSAPGADPVFWVNYARELAEDARQRPAAWYWMNRALRARSLAPWFLSSSALLFMDEAQWDQATERHRLAACLDDRDEGLAKVFFDTSRMVKQTGPALEFLRARWQRFERQSAAPGITFCQALFQLDRGHEAMAFLQVMLQKRPGDGELLLFAALAHERYGRSDLAARFLGQAEGKTHRLRWLESAALLARSRGSRAEALTMLREILEFRPLDLRVNQAVARLLAESHGARAAAEFLEGVCRRFPHHAGLHHLWVGWLEGWDVGQRERVLRHVVTIQPADAWAQRELAWQLAGQGQMEEALERAEEALHLEPHNPYSHNLRGMLFARKGDLGRAEADFRAAIRLSVDTVEAIEALVESCPNLPAKEKALAFVQEELARQTVFGPAVFAFRAQARGILAPETTLARLQEGWRMRPDLWATWAAVVWQLLDLGCSEEALALARDAAQKFPLVAELWQALAAVHRVRSEREEELAALQEALAVAPTNPQLPHDLANACLRAGRADRACSILESACARDPLNAGYRAHLAGLLWSRGEKKTAFERMQLAVRLDPWNESGWQTLRAWGGELQQPDLALEMARRLTEEHAGTARSWLLLGELLLETGQTAEVEAAVERALGLDPRNVDTYDLKARLRVQQALYAEAEACCLVDVFETTPLALRARLVSIQATRGDLALAIEQMTTLLQDYPDFFWGWQNLFHWSRTAGDREVAATAAERMLELDPLSAVPLVYRALLRLDAGDAPGARADFQKAFQLDPTYTFAGLNLLHLQLAGSDLPAAAGTLRVLREQEGESVWDLPEGRLALAEENAESALALLGQLCASGESAAEDVLFLAMLLARRGRLLAVQGALQEALGQASPNPALGEVWVRLHAHLHLWDELCRIDSLAGRGDLGRRAYLSYLESLSEEFDRWSKLNPAERLDRLAPRWANRRFLRRQLRRHRAWLRGDDLLWGGVGRVLVSLGAHKAATEWLADWRERKQARAGTLLDLALAWQRRGRGAEALQALRHCAALPAEGVDTDSGWRVWLALEEGLAGQPDRAEEQLAKTPSELASSDLEPIRVLAAAVVEVQRSGNARRARERMVEGLARNRPRTWRPHARRVYWRVVRWMAARTSSARLRLWGLWFYWG